MTDEQINQVLDEQRLKGTSFKLTIVSADPFSNSPYVNPEFRIELEGKTENLSLQGPIKFWEMLIERAKAAGAK